MLVRAHAGFLTAHVAHAGACAIESEVLQRALVPRRCTSRVEVIACHPSNLPRVGRGSLFVFCYATLLQEQQKQRQRTKEQQQQEEPHILVALGLSTSLLGCVYTCSPPTQPDLT